MAKVILKDVCKIYPGGFQAVKSVNLEIADKEFVVLVGPSGCGKSTTLRMIAGLEEISSGTVSIDGREVNDVPPKDRDIAMVFQNYALYPHMSVFKNMAFGLKLRKYPKDEIDRRVRHAAGILGITDLLDRKPKALSGGQRQRVAVGRAIVRQPKAFLFDEPLSNLDAKMRVQMRTEIIRLHQQLESTMIYVTHDQVEAMTMGDRIVVMKDGFIQQVAPPLELYNHPANTFVAGFIGSPPMNFFSGTLRHEQGAWSFDEGSFQVNVPPGRGLEAYAGKPITLGVRPEAILDAARHQASATLRPVRALLEVTEQMGAEVLLYLNSGTHAFVSRLDKYEGAKVGDRLDFFFDMTRARFFDPATTLAIG